MPHDPDKRAYFIGAMLGTISPRPEKASFINRAKGQLLGQPECQPRGDLVKAPGYHPRTAKARRITVPTLARTDEVIE
jgi:hypothetical protein